MLKNISVYLAVLASVFVFSIFYYEWFSWYLLILLLCVPLLSLILSLPFMVYTCVTGVSISAQDELAAGELLCLRIVPNKGRKLFCPFIKFNLSFVNRFATQKRTVKFLYSGSIDNPIFVKTDALTHNCGMVEINAKYCKIYDFLGIFFIPAKLCCHIEVVVNPQPQVVNLPVDVVENKVISYKKKPNGYADEYELRNYQKGDSLKNIHWKISARHNDLIVKEQSVPVCRPLVLTLALTQNPKENNTTLSKYMYSAYSLCEKNVEFYTALPNGELCEINAKNDVKSFLLRLYKNEYGSKVVQALDNPLIYNIAHNTEAVSTQ